MAATGPTVGSDGWDPLAMAGAVLGVCAVVCLAVFAPEIGAVVKKWRER